MALPCLSKHTSVILIRPVRCKGTSREWNRLRTESSVGGWLTDIRDFTGVRPLAGVNPTGTEKIRESLNDLMGESDGEKSECPIDDGAAQYPGEIDCAQTWNHRKGNCRGALRTAVVCIKISIPRIISAEIRWSRRISNC